ncbi:putative stress up-regulated Nod 19 [Lupinus albus]|uniref:Putative stress up-regulated Nod 19 n=1 Tax=Lupinus albus TaxID=3870 RepID=A0A6A4QAH9_LUPAL|nr:putative stress up-regulated Nod 19 [Lupinus albus]
MRFEFEDLVFSLALLVLVLATPCLGAFETNENNIKSAVFLSPKMELGPGSVSNKLYYDFEFPSGHIAIKSFDAEVVDEDGNKVPLHETYLHHWVVMKYHKLKNVTNKGNGQKSGYAVRNHGLCQGQVLGQFFGLGSETRGTSTHVPDPFGIESGNPEDVPEGYEEKWMANVHAIDTRGVEDKKGCTECRCSLYNVTNDESGKPLSPDYIGGLLCCSDSAQCKVRQGFEGTKRSVYLRYTVKWIDWDNFVVPVKIYIFDVTDTVKKSDYSTGTNPVHHCHVEYHVDPCSTSHKDRNSCIQVNKANIPLQKGGYVVYGVAHQHSGGNGSTLYGQDGSVICSSIPTYGNGTEAGNEADYIVGMSTCYPKPGSVKIADGETLTVVSNYSSNKRGHTGVMGLFYILVAEQLPQQNFRNSFLSSVVPFIRSIFY